jgi:hypothetical protein
MTRRLSVIMLTKARARAPASRDGWKISDSSAADRSAKALLFASSSAGSATVTALPMRPPAPLTCGDLRLFAKHQRVRDPIAQGQILRIEIGGFRQRQRIDQTF